MSCFRGQKPTKSPTAPGSENLKTISSSERIKDSKTSDRTIVPYAILILRMRSQYFWPSKSLVAFPAKRSSKIAGSRIYDGAEEVHARKTK
jgi:hypothetical protein